MKLSNPASGGHRRIMLFTVLALLGGAVCGQGTAGCVPQIGETYLDSIPCWPPKIQAPAGAPNVAVIVLDDVGFGQLGCYGSLIETPSLDRLAKHGLQYTNFHTTGMCSPTRACLLTGRNHHSVHIGTVTDIATGFPGYDMMIPKSAAMLPAVLQPMGYNTYAVGKWHLMPPWEMTPLGPFDRWPTGQGFERYYGFPGAETNQYSPELFDGTRYTGPPVKENYHLAEDLTDRAIQYIRDGRAVNPEKPFLLYLAYGGCHAPHHAPREWINKYLKTKDGGTGEWAGRFDPGWDRVREMVLDRQQAIGVVPRGTMLSPRPAEIPAWDTLSPEEKELYIRMQEVFAAFLSYTDYQIGRFIQYLEEQKILENTLLIVVSDNGASAEGGRVGSFNEVRWFNNIPESFADNYSKINDLGSEKTYNHYPVGWAHAGNTPFKRWKRETFEGGVANPLIIHWPAGTRLQAKDRKADTKRRQFHHAVDIMPTILEAIGVEMPRQVNGVAQMPLEGVSMAYTFKNPLSPTRKETQYFEMLGTRAIWHQGWKASVFHKMDSSFNPLTNTYTNTWLTDKWELYHLDEDVSESRNLAEEDPARLNRLIALWESEAIAHNVLPLDDRMTFRFDPGRPAARPGKQEFTYYPGMTPLGEEAAVNVKNRNFTITVQLAATGDGVLAAHGGRFGGFSLFIKDKILYYVHNYAGTEYSMHSSRELGPEDTLVKFDFKITARYDWGRGLGAPGIGRLYLGEELVGEQPFGKMLPALYGLTGEGFCAGRDVETPVSGLYEAPFAFGGTIVKVVVAVGKLNEVDPPVQNNPGSRFRQ